MASTLLAAGWLVLGWPANALPDPTCAVWLVLFVAVPMLGRGGTIGHRTVLLRPVHADGRTPSRVRLLARSLAGIGGFLLLQSVGDGAAGLASLWGLVSLVGIVRTHEHRGIGGVWTRTVLADRRPVRVP